MNTYKIPKSTLLVLNYLSLYKKGHLDVLLSKFESTANAERAKNEFRLKNTICGSTALTFKDVCLKLNGGKKLQIFILRFLFLATNVCHTFG